STDDGRTSALRRAAEPADDFERLRTMFYRDWLRSLRDRVRPAKKRRAQSRSRQAIPLRVRALEQRCLPTGGPLHLDLHAAGSPTASGYLGVTPTTTFDSSWTAIPTYGWVDSAPGNANSFDSGALPGS